MLDEPTELPEGAVVDLVPLAELVCGSDAALGAEDNAALASGAFAGESVAAAAAAIALNIEDLLRL